MVGKEEHRFVNDVSAPARMEDEEEPRLRQPGDAQLDEEKVKEVWNYFVTSVTEGGYEVVTEPFDGPLRIQISIVDLQVPSTAANASNDL